MLTHIKYLVFDNYFVQPYDILDAIDGKIRVIKDIYGW